MSDLLSKLFDIGKLPSKIVFLIGLVTAIVLFSPASWTERLGTEILVKQYKQFFGIAFICSWALITINISIWCYRRFLQWRFDANFRRGLPLMIQQLDDAEKAVLREFWVQGKSTINLPIDQPTVAGLIEKRMIQHVGSIYQHSIFGIIYPMSLHPLVSLILKAEQVGIPSNPTRAEVERITTLRPAFIDGVSMLEGIRSGRR